MKPNDASLAALTSAAAMFVVANDKVRDLGVAPLMIAALALIVALAVGGAILAVRFASGPHPA